MEKTETLQLNKYIIKYLLLFLAITIIRMLLDMFAPELFTATIIEEGYTQTRTTLFSMYHIYLFNLMIAVFIFLDLKMIGYNFIIIPIMATISLSAGLFFFAIFILDKIINKNGQI